jgi:hypothetical protein
MGEVSESAFSESPHHASSTSFTLSFAAISNLTRASNARPGAAVATRKRSLQADSACQRSPISRRVWREASSFSNSACITSRSCARTADIRALAMSFASFPCSSSRACQAMSLVKMPRRGRQAKGSVKGERG